MTLIAWGCAGVPLAKQQVSGDRGMLLSFPGGALAAVIDGLGHGERACEASLEAERVLQRTPEAPVVELVKRCHDELRKTRGAVMSLASFDAAKAQMTWVGVGNVEGILVRAEAGEPSEAVAMRGGTVGYMLPPLTPRTLDVHPGDTLVLATDGIRHGFKEEVVPERTPQQIADRVMERWHKPSDDAFVLVARYIGEP